MTTKEKVEGRLNEILYPLLIKADSEGGEWTFSEKMWEVLPTDILSLVNEARVEELERLWGVVEDNWVEVIKKDEILGALGKRLDDLKREGGLK